jgi:DNA-binding NarL/FixJ family response regulator
MTVDRINVLIVDTHPILADAMEALLGDVVDINVVGKVLNFDEASSELRAQTTHILMLIIYEPSDDCIEFLKKINQTFPRTKMLILAMNSTENFVFRSLKAGAKGFLSKDDRRTHLLEAIYTLRSGFDYYSRTISNIILKSYISDRTSDNDTEAENEKSLTQREMEVLKLFGEGYSNQKMADMLFISPRTIETHKNNIMQKLKLKSTVDLVKFAIKNNIIKI